MSLAQIMATLIFIAGLILVIVAVLSTIVQVSTIGDLERFLLFGAGVFTLVLAYFMNDRAGR